MEHTLKCPSCGGEIPLSSAIESKLNAEISKVEEGFKQREMNLAKAEAILNETVSAEIKKRESALKIEVAEHLRTQHTSEVLTLNGQLNDIKKREIQLLQSNTELKLKVEEIDLEIERRANAKIERLKATIGQNFQLAYHEKEAELKVQLESSDRRIAEMEMKLTDVRNQLTEAQRKSLQGSQQIQGEVFEQELEAILRQHFPSDTFEPNGTGKQGADILQKVLSENGEIAGSILWEAKRAKNWSNDWIQKLRADSRDAGANFAVLVSEVFPKDSKRLYYEDGIWVCEPGLVPSFTRLLRKVLVQVHFAKTSVKGLNGKAELLHKYLTGPKFVQLVEHAMESISCVRMDLQKEKTFAQKSWKKRETHYELIAVSLANLSGDIQAILGEHCPRISAFGDNENSDEAKLLNPA